MSEESILLRPPDDDPHWQGAGSGLNLPNTVRELLVKMDAMEKRMATLERQVKGVPE